MFSLVQRVTAKYLSESMSAGKSILFVSTRPAPSPRMASTFLAFGLLKRHLRGETWLDLSLSLPLPPMRTCSTDGRFSDILTEARVLLPSISYERDPTLNYKANKAALYAMATCHSLHVVDDHLVGDPLDLKMFEFTGWSFEEGERRSDGSGESEYGRLTPPVARPPAGAEFGLDDDGEVGKVG